MADTQQKSLKGTKTAGYLAQAYVVESTAVTRYTYYAQQCQKESYFQYANIFNETAANELHHAKIFLKYLVDGGVCEASVGVDSGNLSSTVENLKIAAAEEQSEGVDLYKKAAEVAKSEGFDEIAARFLAIASIEAHHEARFNKMSERIATGTVWKRDQPIKWQCLVCGYIYEGTTPPEKCPACYHPYQHFMPAEDNV
ncbi:MAG: rubrerythrin family protein [Bacteroides sp.]|nr:rubrerythrin family protein [Bacteroides sp.]MDE6234652.1 rubrerythrin family protein [Muribaculaceae bacterium]